MSSSTQVETSPLPWSPTIAKSPLSFLNPWGKTTECEKGNQTESALLSNMNDSQGLPPNAQLMDVNIDDAGNYVHTLAIKQEKAKHNLVMTHGYFTGIGYYYRNYQGLSAADGWNVYSIDWLGMGRSSRPKFGVPHTLPEEQRVRDTEAFFVESLEAWRQKMGIEKMMLLGHSFGGYMSALYAMKYPEHVEKLVLVSPIGLPEPPADLAERLKNRDLRRPNKPEDVEKTASTKPGFKQNVIFGVAMSLWERNYTPQWLVRMAGPYGRRLINFYVTKFAFLSDKERADLAAYAYHISVLPGSSEYALGNILKPGAFARRPLVNRMQGLTVPTTFMYGQNDWVESSGGEEAMTRIPAKTQLFTVKECGHNIHLENPQGFNDVVLREMQKLSQGQEAQ
ncbi:hypothetical protein FBU59_005709 [Linderina macrospora]|uniref:Uncharacterized protein n=1 Tax=Linderina macrospora TaxID=4868 RepID=A0ACC1J1W6_9FUNG|nr:hypothetical protein FBU59_005709 [Linderina macrospora]